MRTHRHMDTASAKKIVDTFSDAVKITPLLGEDRNDTEYRRALALVEYPAGHDDPENPLFELLCARISEYEKHASEFKALNQHLEKTPSGVSVLRMLMDRYSLKAADLANELGSKSSVSNILNGRRVLTVSHIKAPTERFNLSADASTE